MPAPTPRAVALKVKQWLADGLTIDEAHKRAQRENLKISRATVGNYSREVDAAAKAERSAGLPPAASTGRQGAAAEEVAALKEEVAFLRRRLDRLEGGGGKKMSLVDVATAAVAMALRKADDPAVDGAVQVKALGALEGLMQMALKAQAAADDDLDDEGLFSASAAPGT